MNSAAPTLEIPHSIQEWICTHKNCPVATLIPNQGNESKTLSELALAPITRDVYQPRVHDDDNLIQLGKNFTGQEHDYNVCMHNDLVDNFAHKSYMASDLEYFMLNENLFQTYCTLCKRNIGCGHIYILIAYRVYKEWPLIASDIFKPSTQSYSYTQCSKCDEQIAFNIPLIVVPESQLMAFRTHMSINFEDEKFIEICRKMTQNGFKIFTEVYERSFINNQLAVQSYMAFVITLAIDTFNNDDEDGVNVYTPPRIKLYICQSIYNTKTSEEARLCFYWALLIADLLCCRWFKGRPQANTYLCVDLNQSTEQLIKDIHARIGALCYIRETELNEQIQQIKNTGLLAYIENKVQNSLGMCFKYMMNNDLKSGTNKNIWDQKKNKNMPPKNNDAYDQGDDWEDMALNPSGLMDGVHSNGHRPVGSNVPGKWPSNVVRPIACYPMPNVLKRELVEEIKPRPLNQLYAHDGHMHIFNKGSECDVCGVTLGAEIPSHVNDEILIKSSMFLEFNKQFCAPNKFHRIVQGLTECVDCGRNPYLTLEDVLQHEEYYNNIKLNRISLEDSSAAETKDALIPSKKSVITLASVDHYYIIRHLTNSSLIRYVEEIHNRTFLQSQLIQPSNRIRHLLYIARTFIELFTPAEEVCNFDTPVVNTIELLYSSNYDLEKTYWVLHRTFERLIKYNETYNQPNFERNMAQCMAQILRQIVDDDNIVNQDTAYNILLMILKMIREDRINQHINEPEFKPHETHITNAVEEFDIIINNTNDDDEQIPEPTALDEIDEDDSIDIKVAADLEGTNVFDGD